LKELQEALPPRRPLSVTLAKVMIEGDGRDSCGNVAGGVAATVEESDVHRVVREVGTGGYSKARGNLRDADQGGGGRGMFDAGGECCSRTSQM